MLNYNKLFDLDSFGLTSKNKNKLFFFNIKKLSQFHYRHSYEYKLISNNLFNSISKIKKIAELPFLHVSLFKNFNLISKTNNTKISTFNSSGTTSNKKSKVNIELKNDYNLSEIKELLSNRGETEINLIIKNKKNHALFSLQENRKFDVNHLKALKAKKYVEKITV